jgi:hypothetical protein
VEHSNQIVLCLWQPQQNATWDAYRSTRWCQAKQLPGCLQWLALNVWLHNHPPQCKPPNLYASIEQLNS